MRLAILSGLTLAMLVASDDAADAKYQELVKRAKSGDLAIDFKDLRMACAEVGNCDARGNSKKMLAMRRAFQDKQFSDAAKEAEGLIDKGFANIEAHAICARAYESLGKTEEAAPHDAIAKGLIRSILDSGDGKTKATAFVVIGTHEEYLIVTVHGLPRPGSQALVAGKPHSYDLLTVTNPKSGQKLEL